jgi:hypothetical protein
MVACPLCRSFRFAAQQHQGTSDSQGAQRAAAEAGDRDARPGQVHMQEEVDDLTFCTSQFKSSVLSIALNSVTSDDHDYACCPLVREVKHHSVFYGGVGGVLALLQQGPRRAVATTVGRGRGGRMCFFLLWRTPLRTVIL